MALYCPSAFLAKFSQQKTTLNNNAKKKEKNQDWSKLYSLGPWKKVWVIEKYE